MGTHIAIIADIHGNCAALKAVLKNIDKDKQIDHIYCLGGLIVLVTKRMKFLKSVFSKRYIFC